MRWLWLKRGWRRVAIAFAAIIREEQNLIAKIETVDEAIVAAYGTRTNNVVVMRREQAVLRSRRDADALEIDKNFPAYRVLIDPNPIVNTCYHVWTAFATEPGHLACLGLYGYGEPVSVPKER